MTKPKKTIEQKRNDLLKKLFCTVVAEDILTVDNPKSPTKIFLDNRPITDSEARALQAEVKMLKNTRLWSIITNTLYSTAQKVMFEESISFDDMRHGKAILYAVDIQKNIIKMIDSLKFDLPKPTMVKYMQGHSY